MTGRVCGESCVQQAGCAAGIHVCGVPSVRRRAVCAGRPCVHRRALCAGGPCVRRAMCAVGGMCRRAVTVCLRDV